jgi:hypothetical protein
VLLPCLWRCSHVGGSGGIKCFCQRVGDGEKGGGSTGSTLGRASRRLSGVEGSRRASLVRVGTQSRVPRLLTYAGLARRVGVGGVLI